MEEQVVSRERNWFGRNKLKLALAATALSATLTFTSDSLNETVDSFQESLPWIGGGLLAGEALWIAGAGMAVSSTGRSALKPWEMRSQFKEISAKANESKLFYSGIMTNTAGAIAQTAIITGGVVSQLPPESWGLLAIPALDLGATLAVRKQIIETVKVNAEKHYQAIE